MADNWKKESYRGASEPTTALKEAERRNAGRHMFTASADVVELGSGARFSTRTTDLGPGGCSSTPQTLSPWDRVLARPSQREERI